MTLRQKAVKGVVWTVIQSWGGRSISFIVFFLLARLLGPQDFGLVSLAGVFLAFVQIFIDQGFSDAIIQRRELEPEHLDTAFVTNLVVGVMLTVFCITVAELVADLFKQPQLTPIIRWLSLNFLINTLSSVQQAILRRNLDFKSLAMRSLAATFVGGIVGVVMALRGFGVWSLVGQQLANSLVAVLVLWQVSNWRPGFKFSMRHLRELFSFGINVLGFSFLNFFNKRADDLLIGYFLGPTALGYYTVAYRILTLMMELLNGTITQVALPTFSKLQQEPERLRGAFYKVTQLTSLIAFPAFLGTAVLAQELVLVLFGEHWLPSVPVMQILSFIGIIHSVSYFDSTVMTAMGKPSWKFWLACLNSVINVTAFALVVRWGIVAVASAYVIRGYFISPISVLLIQRLIKIKLTEYFSQYIAPLAGSLAMVTSILGFRYFFENFIELEVYVFLAICLLIGTLTYTLTLKLIAPTLFRQLFELVRSIIPNKARSKA